MAVKLAEVAAEVSHTILELFEHDEIMGDDLHRMLVAINNLTEYLNRSYIHDPKLEEEVSTMTRTLYNPAVAAQAKAEGKEEGKEEAKIESAISFLDIADDETIAEKLGLSLALVQQLRKEHSVN